MFKILAVCFAMTFAVAGAAQEQPESPGEDAAAPAAAPVEPTATDAPGVKSMLGMSILGNEEAPKSLVIVPWKSSEIGTGIGVSNVLDDSPVAVDRDVFMRELQYYEIRANTAP